MSGDYNRLRLKYHGDSIKLGEILQMECRDKCSRKLPRTLACDGFVFPSLALAEMSTSDAVAEVHASMIDNGCRVVDMTAGLGIDSFHFAAKGCDVTAVELSHDAATALRHNAAVLGYGENVHVIEGDSIEWLTRCDEHFDVIFIDPARRDSSGRHVALKQCSPDITTSISLLLSRAKRVIVKLSPMIDISYAKSELGIRHCDLTVIGTTRECKEVVMSIMASYAFDTEPDDTVTCVTIGNGSYIFSSSEKSDYGMPVTGNYLLQPFPSVMKGTGGRVSGYSKLHPSTHLYVADSPLPEFPGLHYRIIDIVPFNKRDIKRIKTTYPKINVITRNFPLSAPELVKKLSVKEGGDKMLFGAILHDGSKALIITESGFRAMP